MLGPATRRTFRNHNMADDTEMADDVGENNSVFQTAAEPMSEGLEVTLYIAQVMDNALISVG